jgi:hypothetical protein
MFNDVIKEVTGLLERRFLLNAFFPSLIFWGLLIIVAFAGTGWDLSRIVQIWNQQDITFKTIQIVGFLSWVMFFSGILNSQSNAIVRFYEGYCNFPLLSYLISGLARVGKQWHQTQLEALDGKQQMQVLAQRMKKVNQNRQQFEADLNSVNTQQHSSPSGLQPSEIDWIFNQLDKLFKKIQRILLEKKCQQQRKKLEKLNQQVPQLQAKQRTLDESIYLFYPQPSDARKVMPTRLGNILKNSELYSFYQYHIDAVLIWPRLYNLLPERFLQTIAQAKSSLDFDLVISALSGVFGLLSGGYLLIVKAPGWFFLLCFWGGLLVAYFAYESALSSALLYAQQIKAAYDLYRNELLKQMRLPLPKTHLEELKQWEAVCQFLYIGDNPPSRQYQDPDSSKE